MIQLNPIHPAIQKTLQEKIKISGKEENSSKQSILDSKRSVWAKMISLAINNLVFLYGIGTKSNY